MSDYRRPENVEADIERTRQQMSETVEAIQQKLSPGRIVDELLGYFRTESNSSGSSAGASGIANSLVDSVKQNPLPVALIGAGIGWLMMSNNNSAGGRQHYSPQRTGYPNIGNNGNNGTGYHYGPAHSTAHGVDQASTLKDKAGSVKAKAADAAADAKDKLSDAAENVRERSARAADMLQEQAGRQIERAREGFDTMLSEQPLTLIGVGFAIGAALGAGLPPTRKEDELMGEVRDDLKDRAMVAGSQQLEKAKTVADAALDAAREEADKEGLSGEDGKKKLSETKDSVQRVAKAAKDAAEDEMDNQTQGSTSQQKSHTGRSDKKSS